MTERPLPFWTFSLAVYGDSAVQQECLDLQDRCGIDVNLLLYCTFAGAVHGAVLSEQDLRQAAGIVAKWQQEVVRSLRAARRALKPFATASSPIAGAAAALRAGVKAAELEAERIEQTMLQSFGAERLDAWPRDEPAAAVEANMRTLFAICAGPAPQPALPDRLVAAAIYTVRHGRPRT